MREAKPVQKTADIRAVDAHPTPFQLDAKFIKGQVAILLQPGGEEVGMGGKLATTHAMTLSARRQRARLRFQLHQIVHKAWRDPEMPRGLPTAMPFLHKRNHTHPQFHRK